MAINKLLYPVTQNGLQKTLASALDQGVTASMTLNNTTGIDNKPGVAVVDRIDAAGTPKQASFREYIIYLGTSGATLTTLSRGQGGSSDQSHLIGAVVEFVPDVNVFLEIITALASLVDATNTANLNSAIVTLTGIQALTNKTLTAPVIDVITASELKANKNTKVVVADGATITLDLATASVFEFVLGGNRILALSNIPIIDATDVKYLNIRPVQDGTGSRTLTWPSTAVSPITMTIATPGVVTLGKDIPTGTPITFTTTGALPTGVTAGTVYYWIKNDATTGWLATTLALAQAGTKVATSGTQSGVHSAAIQIRWAGGTAPTLSTGAFLRDSIVLCIPDSANGLIEGYVAGQAV